MRQTEKKQLETNTIHTAGVMMELSRSSNGLFFCFFYDQTYLTENPPAAVQWVGIKVPMRDAEKVKKLLWMGNGFEMWFAENKTTGEAFALCHAGRAFGVYGLLYGTQGTCLRLATTWRNDIQLCMVFFFVLFPALILSAGVRLDAAADLQRRGRSGCCDWQPDRGSNGRGVQVYTRLRSHADPPGPRRE